MSPGNLSPRAALILSSLAPGLPSMVAPCSIATDLSLAAKGEPPVMILLIPGTSEAD